MGLVPFLKCQLSNAAGENDCSGAAVFFHVHFISIYQAFPVCSTRSFSSSGTSVSPLPLKTHMKLLLSLQDLSLNKHDFVRKTAGKALTMQWLILDFVSEFWIWL